MKKDKIIVLILIIIFLILFARYLVVKQHIIQKIMYMMKGNRVAIRIVD